MIINGTVIPEKTRFLDCNMDHIKQSEEIVYDLLNETINYAILSSEECKPKRIRDKPVCLKESFESCDSPITQIVPMNSPINTIDSKEGLNTEPITLSLAVSEAFNSKTKNVYGTKDENYSPLDMHLCNSQTKTLENCGTSSCRHVPNVNSPEFVPRTVPISLIHTKLNPNAPPWSPHLTQKSGPFRSTIDNLNCLKISQKSDQPIRNNKLEFELKKLIKEIQDIDYGSKQSEVVADKNEKEGESIVNLTNEETDKVLLITKKSCQTNLVQPYHGIENVKKPPLPDEFQEEWEASQEKEIIVINPEYSSASDNSGEFVTIPHTTGPMYDIDLNTVNSSALTNTDGGKGDILDQRLHEPNFVVPPNSPEVLISSPQNSTEKEIKLPLAASDPAEKKSKKKKWTLGNRLFGLFTKKQSSNN